MISDTQLDEIWGQVTMRSDPASRAQPFLGEIGVKAAISTQTKAQMISPSGRTLTTYSNSFVIAIV